MCKCDPSVSQGFQVYIVHNHLAASRVLFFCGDTAERLLDVNKCLCVLHYYLRRVEEL